ncbi:phage major capsid protein [Vitreimonas flagellata]|uniref:phage major capsid protein n=1 Tax=Vitreimonas flagellata TaxID=2560861 RepID=UPI0010757C4F|nr:phage major capsid protein [Vitreimonas flagellata]
MAAINVGQLVATTLRRRLKKTYDNVSDNIAFYNQLRKRGNMKFDSGRDILVPLEYAVGSLQWYSGTEVLNTTPFDFIDGAVFDWKFGALPIVMTGEERVKNSGEAGLIKLATSKVKNAERGFTNGMGAAVYSDGTGNAGKEIGGLQLLTSTSPSSGTIGGIAASNTFWQNQYFDASTYLGATVTKDNVKQAMNHMRILCTRNNESPDCYFSDNNWYELYSNSMLEIQRLTSESDKKVNAGWVSLEFHGSPFYLDGGQGGNCPANTMYAQNFEYQHFYVHEDRDIEIVGGTRASMNQDADVQIMMIACNMGTANRSLQGVAIL